MQNVFLQIIHVIATQFTSSLCHKFQLDSDAMPGGMSDIVARLDDRSKRCYDLNMARLTVEHNNTMREVKRLAYTHEEHLDCVRLWESYKGGDISALAELTFKFPKVPKANIIQWSKRYRGQQKEDFSQKRLQAKRHVPIGTCKNPEVEERLGDAVRTFDEQHVMFALICSSYSRSCFNPTLTF